MHHLPENTEQETRGAREEKGERPSNWESMGKTKVLSTSGKGCSRRGKRSSPKEKGTRQEGEKIKIHHLCHYYKEEEIPQPYVKQNGVVRKGPEEFGSGLSKRGKGEKE